MRKSMRKKHYRRHIVLKYTLGENRRPMYPMTMYCGMTFGFEQNHHLPPVMPIFGKVGEYLLRWGYKDVCPQCLHRYWKMMDASVK